MFYKHFLIAYGFFHFLNSLKVLVANSTSLKLSAVDGFPHQQLISCQLGVLQFNKRQETKYDSFIYLKKFSPKNVLEVKYTKISGYQKINI